jgi:hypothetical protein
MQASSLDLVLALGMGGSLGALLALHAAGRRFAARLRSLGASLERALLDLRSADLNVLRDEVAAAEREAKSLLALLQGLLRRG